MKKSTSFVFTGDIGFDRYMDNMWNDEELLSKEIIDFFHSAEHVVANVEGPLVKAERNTTTSGAVQLMHTMDTDAIKVLNKINADVWNLANNHIMDAGKFGMESTLAEAEKNHAQTIGAGIDIEQAKKPVFFDEAGGIGMFGVGYQRGCKKATEEIPGSFPWNDMDAIEEVIKSIKEKCRWCIVVAHGGEEFTALPHPYTRDRYLKYLEMGADIVVSHHPHVPMNYELLDNKAIFYSLGNFIFDTDYQRAQFNTDVGVLLKLCLNEETFSFEPLGLKILRGSEHIVKGDLPRIFTDVPAEEYEKLIPLSAKMFLSATKRQQIYMNPKEYTDASDEKWTENFMNPKRSGRVIGEGLDFYIICPLAEREKEGAWKDSKLTEVIDYILEQM